MSILISLAFPLWSFLEASIVESCSPYLAVTTDLLCLASSSSEFFRFFTEQFSLRTFEWKFLRSSYRISLRIVSTRNSKDRVRECKGPETIQNQNTSNVWFENYEAFGYSINFKLYADKGAFSWLLQNLAGIARPEEELSTAIGRPQS